MHYSNILSSLCLLIAFFFGFLYWKKNDLTYDWRNGWTNLRISIWNKYLIKSNVKKDKLRLSSSGHIVTVITYHSNAIKVPDEFMSKVRLIEVGECESCLDLPSIFSIRSNSSYFVNNPIETKYVAYLGKGVVPGNKYWRSIVQFWIEFAKESHINFIGGKVVRKRTSSHVNAVLHSYGYYPYYANVNSVHIQGKYEGMNQGFGKTIQDENALLVDPVSFLMRSELIDEIDYDTFGETYAIYDLCLSKKHVVLKRNLYVEILLPATSTNHTFNRVPSGGYYFPLFDYSRNNFSSSFYNKWTDALRIHMGNHLKAPYTVAYEIGNYGCSGWFREAVDVTTSLEGVIPLRIIADPNKKCHGLPESQDTSINRMISHTFDNITIWISQKPPPQYPKFPYNGSISVESVPQIIIGRSMYEVTLIPKEWTEPANTLVDEIWVPSQFLLDSFANAGVDKSKLFVIPFPIDTTFYDPYITSPMKLPGPEECTLPNTFKLLSVFKWERRRAPEILLEAYFKAFRKDDSICLYLLTYLESGDTPRDKKLIEEKIQSVADSLGIDKSQLPKYVIMNELVPTHEMPSLYKAVDAFVLTTRGEGWGLPIIEAMSMGLPTIASHFGGQSDFMDHSNSYLLDYEKVDPETNLPIPETMSGSTQYWANPNVTHLIELFHRIFTEKEERINKGKLARAHLRNKFSKEVVAQMILKRIRHIMSNIEVYKAKRKQRP